MDRSPELYSRRILLAVTGMSPQIVTETLWALAVRQQPAFLPTEVHVATTQEGVARARLQLLSAEGYFHRLRADYDLPPMVFGEEQIHVICGPNGPLADIRSPEDNEVAADFLTTLVQTFTRDDDSALHVSLAGGRKTMGYYLGYALSLFGRPQDRLSHVLVSSGYESCPQFFYPTPRRQIIYVGQEKHPLDAAQAKIDLAIIPFVRLRDDLPRKYFMHDRLRFTEVVAAANRSLRPPHLVVDVPRSAVLADEQLITRSPTQVALCWWLAEAVQSANHAVDWANIEAIDHFLTKLRRLVTDLSPEYERAKEALAWRRSDPRENKSYFLPLRSRTEKAFKTVLGPSAAERYAIRPMGKRGHDQHYGFVLEADQVEIRDSKRLHAHSSLHRPQADSDQSHACRAGASRSCHSRDRDRTE